MKSQKDAKATFSFYSWNINPSERRADVSRSGTTPNPAPHEGGEAEEWTSLHSLMQPLKQVKHSTFTQTSAKTAKEGPEKKPEADEVDSNKNLNKFLSQHPQKADEGHIQEAFHWRKTQF